MDAHARAIEEWLREHGEQPTPADVEPVASSWALPLHDGTYATVRTIRPREWLAGLRDWLSSDEGRAAHAHVAKKISAEAIMRCATADAEHADHTGRNLTTAHETCAREAGFRNRDTAKIARRFLTHTGWMAELARGRYLRREEREQARATHGGHQWRAASVRALTTPTPEHATRCAAIYAAARTPLPRRGRGSERTSPESVVTNARKRTRGRKATSTPKPQPQRTIQAWKAAQKLIDRHPWLDARGSHRGRLVDGIQPLIDAGWSADDLREAINAEGRFTISPDQQRNPVGLFITQIRRVCAARPAPAVVAAEQAAKRRARQQERARAAAAAEASKATPEQVAEKMAAIRATLQAAKARSHASNVGRG